MAKNEGMGEVARPPGATAGRGRPLLSLLMALALAVAVAGLIHLGRDIAPVWLLLIGGVLSLIGLLALFGLGAGILQFGSPSRHRAFLDGFADAVGDPLVVTDAKGRAVYANGPYITLASNAGAGRLVGMDVLYAGYSEFAGPVYQLAQAVSDGRREEREIRVPAGSSAPGARADRPVWLRIKAAPAMLEGSANYRLWQLQDISADRARQEQAFARLQFIINYLDLAPAGFFSTLPDGRIDYLNATLAGWLGLDVAQSQSGGLLLAELVGEAGAKLLCGLEPAAGTVTETFDMDLRDKAGKALPVHIIHRVDFDGNGRPLPSRSLAVPRGAGESGTTDSVSSLRLMRFFNGAPIGIAEVAADGTVRQGNSAFLALSPAIRRGAKLSAAVVPADHDVLNRAQSQAFAAEGALSSAEVTLAGDPQRAVQLSFMLLAPGDDGLSVFATDKTESKALEVQLAQAQKMQAVGQLASGIAHDFNNVLTPIIGFADLLLAKMRPTDPSFSDVMSIKQNANRAANLVRQLLAFSRRQTLQPKVHSLTEAMSDLQNLLSRVLGEKVALKISHGRDLGLVLVDIHQFEQVIINLAVNARDAMPNGGTLTVRTFNVSEEESRTVKADLMPPGEYVACEVEDTGTGIPPEILNKIWEPFFSTKDVGKGTGLGLSTVYGIVKQTGGFIFCDSTVGKGTTFRIFLPRHYPDVSAVEAVPEPAAAPPRAGHTGNGRILVVEDEDAVRAFAVRALTSRGYTVVEADSGESALKVIEADDTGFELILSDVVMPELDGPALLRELRKRGITTKLIFVSGYPGDQFESDLEGQTDYDFLSKPFSLKQLIEKVKDVMER
ncbi:ATP-binding protein [Aestuariivirga sp.]|uniref:ATP-binding protein n=1 Tax=Aestuariivirga sp. TaxID=2650926 RepID=UPI0039E4F0E4